MPRLAAAGLILLALAPTSAQAASPPDASEGERVTVVLAEYHFVPNELKFRRGVHYRLHLENQGKELHEFTAPEFFMAIEVRNAEVLASDGHEVVLRPQEQKDVDFIPRRAGRYRLYCADHDYFGMTGEIDVE